jgi:hypothetical protein
MKITQLRQLIREEIKSVMKEQEAIKITPEQKAAFLDRIKGYAEDEGADSAFFEAGNILARVLTDDEAEFIEDVEDFGYNAQEVEDYAQDLVGSLDLEFDYDDNDYDDDF